MKNVYKALSLLLLLLTAQQGAVTHELSHFSLGDRVELRIDAGSAADALCAQCPAFAQAATPTFGHSFTFPPPARTTSLLAPEPRSAALDATVPHPRSRGPPS